MVLFTGEVLLGTYWRLTEDYALKMIPDGESDIRAIPLDEVQEAILHGANRSVATMGQDEDLLLRARIQGWKPSVPWRIAHAAHELERVAEELRATGSEYEEAQYLLEEAVGRAEIALTRVLLIGNPYLREKSRPEAPNAD